MAFTALARLFLAPDLTPPQVLVKSEKNAIVGLASEYLTYAIARREVLPATFYQLNPDLTKCRDELSLLALQVNDTDNLPFYFLNQCPPGFFNTLSKNAKAGKINLDMASLVSVLTSSYSLEEDDLHKGNVGFYVVHKNDKPHVVFFKIDHDLMLADSVMSHCHTRFLNAFYSTGAFAVTKRDLVNFPSLTDSQNYYWPTRKHSIFASGDKAYTSNADIQSFIDLATLPEFRRIKWQEFYKHVLIPPALIQQSLAKHLDNKNPIDRAQIALITQSVVTRQAKLRAVLFTIPEFRDFVVSLKDHDYHNMVQSIVFSADPVKVGELSEEITASMIRYEALCGNFVSGDTPLHAAIRLGDYRYYDTQECFGHYVNQKNQQGKTPLDVAVSMAAAPQVMVGDVRCDLLSTMKHLVRQGAKTTLDYLQFTQGRQVNPSDYIYHSGYSCRASEAKNLAQLKSILCELGEDHRYSLKMQKELAVTCVFRFIKHHQNNAYLREMLSTLKEDLNGTRVSPPAAELQFIRQLRSQLWIVRFIRGLLGGTATQVQLNHLIDRALKQIMPPAPSCWSFFSKKNHHCEQPRDSEHKPLGCPQASK